MRIAVVLVSAAALIGAAPPETSAAPGLNSFAQRILAAHNAERAGVGAPPLRWDATLAAHAAAYAQQLAQMRQLVHSSRERRGAERENLVMAPIGWSPEQMAQLWVNERRNFTPGLFPNVTRTGNWMDVAHYTQMIWPTTTDVGCAMAPGGEFDWLVCRYSPGGNKDGKPVGQAVYRAPERGR